MSGHKACHTEEKGAILDSRKHSEKEKPHRTPDQSPEKTTSSGSLTPKQCADSLLSPLSSAPRVWQSQIIGLCNFLGRDTDRNLGTQWSTPRGMAQNIGIGEA